MTPPPPLPPDDRLEQLREKIHAAQESEIDGPAPPAPNSETVRKPRNTGLQAGIELIGGIAGGTALGLLVDRWLDTRPLFMILLFLLGTAAGFVAVWKTSQGIGTGVGFSPLHKREKDAKTPD